MVRLTTIRTTSPFGKRRLHDVTRAERSDTTRNRAAVLAAADELFATVPEPARLSMDDVAAAAGVGKGTLFAPSATGPGSSRPYGCS